MPGEEGYPAYLGSRVAEFYERAGRTVNLGSNNIEGALTVVGAVPTWRRPVRTGYTGNPAYCKGFLESGCCFAYRRHFPAINWLSSYSLYQADIDPYLRKLWAESGSR